MDIEKQNDGLITVKTPSYVVTRVFKSEEKAILVKPIPRLKIKGESFTVNTQLERCNNAVTISRECLPDLSIEQKLYVGSYQGEDFVIRECEWLDDVVPLSELQLSEILKDRKISESLERIFLFAIDQFLIHGRKFDFINSVFDDSSAHPFILKLLGSIRNKNVFVGEKNGKKIIFLDSDWYTDITDNKYSFKQLATPFAIFTINYLALVVINSLRSLYINSEKGSGLRIQVS